MAFLGNMPLRQDESHLQNGLQEYPFNLYPVHTINNLKNSNHNFFKPPTVYSNKFNIEHIDTEKSFALESYYNRQDINEYQVHSNVRRINNPIYSRRTPPKNITLTVPDLTNNELYIVDSILNTSGKMSTLPFNRANLKELIKQGNLTALEEFVLQGNGDRLLGETSSAPLVQEFLDNLPTYLDQINELHKAASRGSLRDFQSLLDRSSLILSRDPLGATPLHKATLYGHHELSDHIAANYGEIALDAKDNDGRTALHYAAGLNDDRALYQMLLKHGAKSSIIDQKHKTPDFYLRFPDELNLSHIMKRSQRLNANHTINLANRIKSKSPSRRKERSLSPTLPWNRYNSGVNNNNNNNNNNINDIDMDVDADLSSNDESVISNGSSIVKRQSGSFNHPQSHRIEINSANLRRWIEENNTEMLDGAILEGHGDQICAKASNVLKDVDNVGSQQYIEEMVPQMMSRIQHIHAAVSVGDLTSLQEGLEMKKDYILSKDHLGMSPLHKATIMGHVNVVQYILEKFPETVNARDREGRTALHYSTATTNRNGNKIYKMLTRSGADPRVRDLHGKTADYYRVHLLSLPSNEALRGPINKGNLFGGKGSQTKTVTGLLAEPKSRRITQPGVREKINNALHSGNVSQLQELVIDGYGQELLGRTSFGEDARRLLKNIPHSLDLIRELQEAAINGDQTTIERLLNENGQFARVRDINSFTLMHLSVVGGHLNLVNYLATNFPTLTNLKDNMNRTGLHLAAMTGNTDIYRRLIELGLDSRSLDQKGKTAEYYLRNNPAVSSTELQELLLLSSQNVPSSMLPTNSRLTKMSKSSSKSNPSLTEQTSPLVSANGSISGSGLKLSSKPVRLPALSRPNGDRTNINKNSSSAEQIEDNNSVIEPTTTTSSKEEETNNETNKESNMIEEPKSEPINENETQAKNEENTIVDELVNEPDMSKGNADKSQSDEVSQIVKDDLQDITSDEVVTENERVVVYSRGNLQSEGNEGLWQPIDIPPDENSIKVESDKVNEPTNSSSEQAVEEINQFENSNENGDHKDDKVDENEKNVQENDPKTEDNRNDDSAQVAEADPTNIDLQNENVILSNVNDSNIIKESSDIPTDQSEQQDQNKTEMIVEEIKESTENNNEIISEETIVPKEEINDQNDIIPSNEVTTTTQQTDQIGQVINENNDKPNEEMNDSQMNLVNNENSAINSGGDDKSTVAMSNNGQSPVPDEINKEQMEQMENENANENDKLKPEIDVKEIENKSSSEQDDTSNEDKLEQIIETVTDKQEDGNISNRSTDRLNELIKHWLEEGDLLRLEHVVIAGQGDRLLNVRTNDKQVEDFLNLVPAYMEKIKNVHTAVAHGNMEEVQKILTRKRFALCRDQYGASPLHLSVLHGHIDILIYIITQFPETIDGPDNDGRTPLHYAAVLPDKQIYEILETANANKEQKDRFNFTPEQYLTNGKLAIRDLLIKYSKDVPKNSSTDVWERPPTSEIISQLTPDSGSIPSTANVEPDMVVMNEDVTVIEDQNNESNDGTTEKTVQILQIEPRQREFSIEMDDAKEETNSDYVETTKNDLMMNKIDEENPSLKSIDEEKTNEDGKIEGDEDEQLNNTNEQTTNINKGKLKRMETFDSGTESKLGKRELSKMDSSSPSDDKAFEIMSDDFRRSLRNEKIRLQKSIDNQLDSSDIIKPIGKNGSVIDTIQDARSTTLNGQIVNGLNASGYDLTQIKDELGRTVLHLAAAKEQKRNTLYKMLQQANYLVPERDCKYRTIRDVAVLNGIKTNLQVIDQFVLDCFIKRDSDYLRMLMIEGYNNLLTVVDSEGNDVIGVLKKHNIDTMQPIIHELAQLQKNRDELHTFIRHGYIEGVTNLVETDSQLVIAKSDRGRTSLHLAVLFGNLDIIETLINANHKSVNIPDNLGRTPLHYAMAMSKMEELGRVLIHCGANKTVRDVRMRTPTYYFVYKQEIRDIKREEQNLTI